MSDQSESPRRRRRAPQQTATPAQGSAVKGVILVVVAVFIGFALLQDQDSSTAQVSVGAEDDPAAGEDEGDGDGEEIDETTSSTTAAPRPPADVKVLVANGSETSGAAGTQSDALEALGYVTGNPTNANGLVQQTVVYFEPGYQAEAEVLAEALGLETSAAKPIPTPAPVTDMQLSNVLVVVGPDIAAAG